MNKPYKNVFRIDTGATHGWQVRVQRQGEQHTKFFSDSRYNSEEEALEEARTYRDELIERLPERAPGGDPQKAGRSTNWSGVIGISFAMKGRRGDRQFPYVQGYWTDTDGKRHSTSIAINKWGLKSALWQVCNTLFEERMKRGEDPPSPEEMFETAFPKLRERVPEEFLSKRAA